MVKQLPICEICVNERSCYLDGTCDDPYVVPDGKSGDFFLADGTNIAFGWTHSNAEFDIQVLFPTGKDAYLGKSIFWYFLYLIIHTMDIFCKVS